MKNRTPESPEPLKEIAQQLLKKRGEILLHWENEVRSKVPAAKAQSSLVLLNALPVFLSEVAKSLSPDHTMTEPSPEVCREHGEQRAHLSQYSLQEIIDEYEILLTSIFAVLEADHPLPGQARDIIIRSVLRGITGAAIEYGKVQDLMREQFIAIVAHDLKNPLSAAKISIQLAARAARGNARVEELAGRSGNSIARVERMLQDLLDTFTIRAGKSFPVELVEGDYRKVAHEAVEELSTVHGARFVLDAPTALPGFFSADALRRSIENLGNNAVKYGNRYDPITIRVQEGTGNTVRITVHNHGSPMIAEEQAKLFQPSNRGPFVKAGGQKGWGVGLILVHGVVKAHHGDVEVKSSRRDGTAFTLVLPRDPRLVAGGTPSPGLRTSPPPPPEAAKAVKPPRLPGF
jgi:signal transduction histidine kinase